MKKDIGNMLNEAINDDLAYKLAMQFGSSRDICKHCGSTTGFPFIRLLGFHKILEDMRKGSFAKHHYLGYVTLERKGDAVLVINKEIRTQKTYPLNLRD